MGNGVVRYKAEIDFDGRELARSYIERSDMRQLLPEVRTSTNLASFGNSFIIFATSGSCHHYRERC